MFEGEGFTRGVKIFTEKFEFENVFEGMTRLQIYENNILINQRSSIGLFKDIKSSELVEVKCCERDIHSFKMISSKHILVLYTDGCVAVIILGRGYKVTQQMIQLPIKQQKETVFAELQVDNELENASVVVTNVGPNGHHQELFWISLMQDNHYTPRLVCSFMFNHTKGTRLVGPMAFMSVTSNSTPILWVTEKKEISLASSKSHKFFCLTAYYLNSR